MSNKTHFSPACERNREPIWAELQSIIRADDRVVLEIGAGTGQHAAYMVPRLPELLWYPTDTEDKMAGIETWRQEAHCERIQVPRIFQVGHNEWPLKPGEADLVFTANTFHNVNEPVSNPAFLTHEQATEAATWVMETEDALPFRGFALSVESVMPQGAITDTGATRVHDLPWSEGEQGPASRDVTLNWSRPVKGRVRYAVRMDQTG